MGAAGSHFNVLPNLKYKQRKAAFAQAISRKFEKRKKILKTIKRVINSQYKLESKDHCKAFKSLLCSWSTAEISRLVEIYESTITLNDVASEAASARCLGSCLQSDLQEFMQKGMCTDVELIYLGSSYFLHSTILSCRSTYFKKMIHCHRTEEVNCIMTIPPIAKIDGAAFEAMLCYIYTDYLPDNDPTLKVSLDFLQQQFGINESVTQAVHGLYERMDRADLALTFVKTCSPGTSPHCEPVKLASFLCHSAVVASRSDLLSNLICKAQNNRLLNNIPTEVVLDDSVVSHRYGPLILKLIYQDEFDIDLVNCHTNALASSSLSEVQAIVSGKSNVSLVDEAIELHHIGSFIELPILTEKCEEYIVQSLSPEHLTTILSWSQQPSGSKWVYREALQYIQDNFLQLSRSPIFLALDQTTLSKVLQSDALQASEIDILQAVISWSEHQLIKAIESREPNLITHTAHSLARKGIKSKDVNNAELAEIASQLITHVRVSHFVPHNSEIVTNAVKRQILGNTLLSHGHDMALSEPFLHSQSLHNHQDLWLPSYKASSSYVVPRAYMPFYEIARSVLYERTRDLSESEVVHLKRPSRLAQRSLGPSGYNLQIRHCTVQNMTRSQEEDSTPFTEETINEVIHRTEQLLQTRCVVQALQACWDKTAVLKQVCLWAARELGCQEHIIYTVKAKTSNVSQPTDYPQANLSSTSLVPDLAPERLLLQHGVSASCENLMVHSVNSSPDVTLLSVRSQRSHTNMQQYPDVTQHSNSGSENSLRGSYNKQRGSVAKRKGCPRVVLPMSNTSASCLPQKSDERSSYDDSRPDVLADSSVVSSVAPNYYRQISTLGPRTDRSKTYWGHAADVNPYYTPPRTSIQNRSRSSDYSQSLHLSSLRGAMHIGYDLMERAGPPPDIAPRPARRLTGTSAPPDVTSSPNNTWQAML